MFKPSPDAYTLIQSNLGVAPSEVLFVSSNPFDVCGAKSFGLKVAWIERVTPEAMATACIDNNTVAPTNNVQGATDADGRTRFPARCPDLVSIRYSARIG